MGGTAGAGGTAASNGGEGGAGGAGANTGGGGTSTGGTGVNTQHTYAGCTSHGGTELWVIASLDPARDLCVVLTLANPVSNPYPELTLPADIGVLYAFAQTKPVGAKNCLALYPRADSVAATGATGTVTFLPTPQLTANVNVTLAFPPSAGVPVEPTEWLYATSLLLPPNCP